MPIQQVVVIGAGSWGTALAKMLSDKGYRVTLWGHRQDHVDEIDRNRENLTYLPGFKLNDNLSATADLKEAVTGQPVVVMVVPSHGFREVVRRFLAVLPEGARPLLVSSTKGVDHETLERMSQVTASEAERAGLRVGFAVVSGPTFAAELSAGVPSAAVVASADARVAQLEQQAVDELLLTRILELVVESQVETRAKTDQGLGGALLGQPPCALLGQSSGGQPDVSLGERLGFERRREFKVHSQLRLQRLRGASGTRAVGHADSKRPLQKRCEAGDIRRAALEHRRR